MEYNQDYLFGKHFNSGQNINIYSLQAEHLFVEQFINQHYVSQDEIADELLSCEVTNPLKDFVTSQYKSILTSKQIEYVQMPDAVKMKKVAQPHRSRFRKLMTKRVMLKLTGYDIEYYHKLNTHLAQLIVIENSFAVDDDNSKLSEYIKSVIDTPYMEELVYDRLSCCNRYLLTKAVTGEHDIPAKALYEVSKLMLQDYDFIQNEFKNRAVNA